VTQDPTFQLAQLPVAGTTRILPIAGSTAGAFGSLFRTTVQLHDGGDAATHGRLVFHPAGRSGSASDPSVEYTLSAGETLALADVVARMGVSGVGSIDIVSDGAMPLAVARVYNDGAEHGTTGLSFASVDPADALRAGQSGVIFVPSDLAKLRLNIGIRTLGDTSMTAAIRSASGATLVTRSLHLGADTMQQTGAADLLAFTFTGGETITFTIDQGSAIVFGATTDNTTNDPAVQFAKKVF
jgi:hypothetical protein